MITVKRKNKQIVTRWILLETNRRERKLVLSDTLCWKEPNFKLRLVEPKYFASINGFICFAASERLNRELCDREVLPTEWKSRPCALSKISARRKWCKPFQWSRRCSISSAKMKLFGLSAATLQYKQNVNDSIFRSCTAEKNKRKTQS